MTILGDEISWKAFNYVVNCHQIKLSIDIHCNSNVWRSICTAWKVFMPSWRGHHSIALVFGTILRTIDCVYYPLPGGNPPFAEQKALQSEQWHSLHLMTSVACAFSTARRFGTFVGWLHSWDNLRTTQFAPRCTRSNQEHGVWCNTNARCRKRSSPRVLNLVSRLLIHEVPGGCARWMLGRFVFVNKQNKLNKEIAGTWVYRSVQPGYTCIRISSRIQHTTHILNYVDITWLAWSTVSHSKTHPMTYTTLYIPSGLPSATSNCIIMLMPRM